MPTQAMAQPLRVTRRNLSVSVQTTPLRRKESEASKRTNGYTYTMSYEAFEYYADGFLTRANKEGSESWASQGTGPTWKNGLACKLPLQPTR